MVSDYIHVLDMRVPERGGNIKNLSVPFLVHGGENTREGKTLRTEKSSVPRLTELKSIKVEAI